MFVVKDSKVRHQTDGSQVQAQESDAAKQVHEVLPLLPVLFGEFYRQQELVRTGQITVYPNLQVIGPVCEVQLRHKYAARPHLEASWRRITNLDPGTSHFTVVLPIHNEQHLLPTVLRLLNRSNIPTSVRMTIVLVVNGSTDESHQMALRYLRRMKDSGFCFTAKYLDISQVADSGLNDCCYKANHGNTEIILFQTKTASKANALNIASLVAQTKGDQICLCVDADSLLEPNSIPQIIGDAVSQGLDKSASEVVVVNGSSREVCNPSRDKSSLLGRWIAKNRAFETPANPYSIRGHFFAWNVDWLILQKGFKSGVLEDLRLSLQVKLDHKKMGTSKASAWVFYPAKLGDIFTVHRRYAVGVLQIADELGHSSFKELTKDAGAWSLYLASTAWRFKSLVLSRLKQEGLANVPRILLNYLAFEAWRWLGFRDYKRDPNQASWKAAQSTK